MTWFWHFVTGLVGITVLTGLGINVVALLAARRHFKTSFPGLPAPAPKVSILKPVEEAGPESYAAFATFCRLDYPGEIELLIGTVQRDDPAVAMVHRLQREFPGRAIRVVFAGLQGTNRKTSIMETLWRNATGELLFFTDADVLVPADYLRRLVPVLAQPGVGCLTCLPRGVQAATLGGKMIALHYGFNFLPQWMLARQTTGIHWAVGHTMAVPRGVLEKLGGFSRFLNHLADDYELGQRVSQLGLRVVVAPLLLDCQMPRESLFAAFKRMLRWKRTIWRARGLQYLGVVFTLPVFWASLLVLLHPWSGWAWAALGATLAIRWLLALQLQRIVHLPDWWRAWWLLLLVDVVEGITFLVAYFGSNIIWAGRRYSLHKDGTLEPKPVKVRPKLANQ